jgi:TatA/E family protein of Tat protein translocase
MFGSLGLPELLLIFAVALIVFGPRKLPEIGRTLGKALGEFKKATDDLKSTIEREVHLEEIKTITTSAMSPVETVSRAEPSRTEPPATIAPPPERTDYTQPAE